MYCLPAFWNSGRSLPPPDLDLHGPTERLQLFGQAVEKRSAGEVGLNG